MGHVYRPAWWLPGPHLPTLWAKLLRRRPSISPRRERWDTADGDFVDLYRIDAPEGRRTPRLIVLHGLEGSPRSQYARGLLHQAARRGWAADLLVFRSCGEEPNRLARSYHSGETSDLDFVVRRLTGEDPTRAVVLAGVSLGGNVLLKWLGESAHDLPAQVCGAAAVSVPFDLARGARHLDTGFARVYRDHFLRSLRRKAHEKRTRFPELLSAAAIDRARTFYEFDDAVTAPLHGFASADDYYSRSSSIQYLDRISIPTLLISARDDPVLPAAVLDDVMTITRENPALTVEFLPRGGHVGFVSGQVPWRAVYYAEWRVADFLQQCVGSLQPARSASPV
ncbi:MAG: hydrolase [Gemmatimonadaceae bacterium]